MARGKWLSEEEKASIVEMHTGGMTAAQIAAKMERGVKSIQRVLKDGVGGAQTQPSPTAVHISANQCDRSASVQVMGPPAAPFVATIHCAAGMASSPQVHPHSQAATTTHTKPPEPLAQSAVRAVKRPKKIPARAVSEKESAAPRPGTADLTVSLAKSAQYHPHPSQQQLATLAPQCVQPQRLGVLPSAPSPLSGIISSQPPTTPHVQALLPGPFMTSLISSPTRASNGHQLQRSGDIDHGFPHGLSNEPTPTHTGREQHEPMMSMVNVIPDESDDEMLSMVESRAAAAQHHVTRSDSQVTGQDTGTQVQSTTREATFRNNPPQESVRIIEDSPLRNFESMLDSSPCRPTQSDNSSQVEPEPSVSKKRKVGADTLVKPSSTSIDHAMQILHEAIQRSKPASSSTFHDEHLELLFQRFQADIRLLQLAKRRDEVTHA